VQTLYPGASPEVMSNTVTAPLERQFGQMSGLDRMSSTSAAGVSIITLQFALGQTLDVAEQQVQAAINAGGSLLPADLPAPPVYAKVNPADAPVLTLAITSDTLPLTEVQNLVNTRLAQKISQVGGRGAGVAQRRAAPGRAHPGQHAGAGRTASAWTRCAPPSPRPTPTAPRAASTAPSGPTPSTPTTSCHGDDYKNLIVAYKNGAPIRMVDVAQVVDSAENTQLGAWAGCARAASAHAHAGHHPERAAPARRQRDRHGRRHQEAAARAAGGLPAFAEDRGAERPHRRHPRLGAARRDRTGAGRGAGGAGDLFFLAACAPPSSPAWPCPSRSSAPAGSCTCWATA
jgi:hypothetical protein